MVRIGKIFLLGIWALFGLAACSTSSIELDAEDVIMLPSGQASFLISFADW